MSVASNGAAGRQLKVLVLGGYGAFGERLCRILALDPRIAIVVAGRSLSKAQAVCARLPTGTSCSATVLDRDGDLDSVLRDARPDLLVDATGPWQVYGEHPYRLVEACLANGIDYLDFADDAAFVRGVAALDAQARAAGRFALAGVSSFPVLTAAVVRDLARDLAQVRSIRAGIAPSPYAVFGRNVIEAIACYAGKRIALVRDGRAATGHALVETQRYTVSPPGALPLRDIRYSLVDVPDHQLLPDAWPGLDAIWIGVGTVPESLHRVLNVVARAVSWRLLPSLRWLAPVMHWVTNRLRWGEHRGGMFVEVRGVDATGAEARRSWHLVAEGDTGPKIPCLAIDAVIRKWLDGDAPAPGARPATDALELADYAPAFARMGVVTGSRDDIAEAARGSMFARLLGAAWDALPAPVRALHGTDPEATLAGRATVTRGRGVIARLVAAVFGFPAAGEDVPVEVHLHRQPHRERWVRTFAGRRFASTMTPRHDRLLCESFGPVRINLALVVDGERLRFVVRGWSLLGLPLPRRWAPTGESHETACDGRFRFHIEIAHPLAGPIVTYDGWLQPA